MCDNIADSGYIEQRISMEACAHFAVLFPAKKLKCDNFAVEF